MERTLRGFEVLKRPNPLQDADMASNIKVIEEIRSYFITKAVIRGAITSSTRAGKHLA